MNTNETKRRPPTQKKADQKPRKAETARKKAAEPARKKAAEPARKRTAEKTWRKTSPPARKRSVKEERETRTAASRQRPAQRSRVVRAPREDVPKVVYTAPKPMGRGGVILRLVSMLAVVVAVFMCLSVFFKVDTILVAGPEQYTAWMVREASGVEEGDSLLTVGRARVAGRIKEALPYVDQVKVTISLPGTVRIELTEFPVSYAIASEGGAWWLITSDGTAQEQITAAKATAYTKILGLEIAAPKVGQTVTAAVQTETGEGGTEVLEDQAAVDKKLEAVLTILAALEDNQVIGDAVSLDVTNIGDITIQYSQLLSVRLGDSRKLDYKISYMAAAIRQLDEYQNGELDVTFEYSDSAIFNPVE